MNGLRHIAMELAYHAPFTALGTMLGLAFVTLIVLNVPATEIYEGLFHTLHPLHMFLSAIATTAVYFRHRRTLLGAITVGVIGSVGICSISDIFLPYLGGALLGVKELELHICLLKHPWLVLAPAFLGAFVALPLTVKTENSSLLPHGGHVMVSVLASLTYLAAFSNPVALISFYMPQTFTIVFLAVLLPCCTSDIVLPVAALHGCLCEHDEHFKRPLLFKVLRRNRA